MEAVQLAQGFSTYGVYALIGCLVVAVVYLYRRTNELADKMAEQNAKNNKDLMEITVKATAALKDSTEAIQQIRDFMINHH